ncbi:hypothetical protein C943_00857 [Mariniradius saccharolyticus AK6]|uniref:Uncharacterized protein n=1 Tax=Mariniradius saccharolyticus AK6 TaxID=1239962 RepID=M7Y6K2_9BACT|nr:hypothetical protein C943_00857 [Mariniradius saccharolyticus AK6]
MLFPILVYASFGAVFTHFQTIFKLKLSPFSAIQLGWFKIKFGKSRSKSSRCPLGERYSV